MVRGKEAGSFCKVAVVSIVAAGGPCFTVDILTVESSVAQINLNLNIST